MTTTAVRLEQYEEVFCAYTRGTSDFLYGLKMHECPYPARTLLGDAWELAWGRAQKITEGAALQPTTAPNQQLKQAITLVRSTAIREFSDLTVSDPFGDVLYALEKL